MLPLLAAVLLGQSPCVLKDNIVIAGTPIRLVTPGGAHFASVWLGKIEAAHTTDGPFDLRGLSEGLRFNVRTRLETAFISTAPTELAPGFSAGRGTPVELVRIVGPDAVIRVAERDDVGFLVPRAEKTLPCGDLKLSARRISSKDSSSHLEPEEMLFSAPDGEALYRLRTRGYVERLEVKEGWSRVDVTLEDGARVRGWVHRLVDKTKGFAVQFHDDPRSGVFGPTPSQCARPLQVLIRHDGEAPAPFGELQAKAYFEVRARDAQWVTIDVRNRPITFEPGWSLIVAADELERCGAISH